MKIYFIRYIIMHIGMLCSYLHSRSINVTTVLLSRLPKVEDIVNCRLRWHTSVVSLFPEKCFIYMFSLIILLCENVCSFWKQNIQTISIKLSEVSAVFVVVVWDDISIKTILGSYLPPVVYRNTHVLFTLFVCA